MASASIVTSILCSSASTSKSAAVSRTTRIPFFKNRPSLRPLSSVVRRSLQQQQERADQASSVAVASGEHQLEEAKASHHVGGEDEVKASGHVGGDGGHEEGDGEEEQRRKDEQQEVDWKSDAEFKKFMGNPSIEAAIKLEKKRADRKLRELDREPDANPVAGLFWGLAKDQLAREKKRLELAEQTFKALDLNKSCFGYDTFFAVDVRRFGDGGIFIGNLRKPVEEVRPKLEKKIAEAARTEVTLWFMEDQADDITKQVCMVQPKAEIDLQLEISKLSTPWGYLSAVALAVTTFGTIALMSGFFLKPGATFDDYVSDVLPLFGGFLSILGVSEIATRLTAAKYGVKLSPSFLVPSNWTGCLGVMNNYESLLPNKKTLFDIPVARTASAYLTSIALAVSAFIADGSFNGGENALHVCPAGVLLQQPASVVRAAGYRPVRGRARQRAPERGGGRGRARGSAGVRGAAGHRGDVAEPAAHRAAGGRPHRAGAVRARHGGAAVVRHVTASRRRRHQRQCAVPGLGAVGHVHPRRGGDPGARRDHAARQRQGRVGVRARRCMPPHALPQRRGDVLQLLPQRALLQRRHLDAGSDATWVAL